MIQKQGVTEAEMQKKIAQKEVTLQQKQIDVVKQKLQKDKMLVFCGSSKSIRD